jgi:hypothetical protein
MGSSALRITPESLLVRDTEPVKADFDEGSVLLSLRAGSYFSLNPVASEIWQMLAKPCQVAQIFASLSADYSVDSQVVARDVTPFLQNLINHQLARIIDPSLKP